MVLCLGLVVIATGAALLTDERVLGYAVMTSGAAIIGSGVAWQTGRQALIAAAVIMSGAAVAGFGVAEIGLPVLGSRLRRLRDWALKAPLGATIPGDAVR